MLINSHCSLAKIKKSKEMHPVMFGKKTGAEYTFACTAGEPRIIDD